MKKCTCDLWEFNWPQLKKVQIFSILHGINYTADMFKYCPWCGKKLIEVITNE